MLMFSLILLVVRGACSVERVGEPVQPQPTLPRPARFGRRT